MESDLEKWINEAAQIREGGRWEALKGRLRELAGLPNGAERVWMLRVFAGPTAQTLSAYSMLERSHNESSADACAIAWLARNLLELSVWAMYCTQNRDHARRLYEDAGRDANDLLKVFSKSDETTSKSTERMERGDQTRRTLAQQALQQGIASLEGRFKDVREAAVEIGIGNEFRMQFKFLSKFAHPTAMQFVSLVHKPDLTLRAPETVLCVWLPVLSRCFLALGGAHLLIRPMDRPRTCHRDILTT